MLNQLLLIITFLCFSTAFAQSPALPPQPPATQSPAQPPQVPVTQSPPPALAPQVPLVQSPPAQLAPGPAPPGPPNITAILEKAGHFSTYIRLLKATQIDSQIYKLLNDSSQSLTVFAPSDNAFGNLTTGTLNSFSDEQKVQLVKFHVIPSFLSIPAFQTVSNPLSTQAGSTVQYPMNVTTAGNLVNIRTGIVNTTVTGTVYSDNQLAVYQVDRVLLPLSFFVSISPAPAPSKPVKKAPSPVSDQSASSTDASVQASGAVPHRALNVAGCFAGLVIAVIPGTERKDGMTWNFTSWTFCSSEKELRVPVERLPKALSDGANTVRLWLESLRMMLGGPGGAGPGASCAGGDWTSGTCGASAGGGDWVAGTWGGCAGD
ncbi:unnamed protein product [Camellia sinensis]